MFSKKLQEEVSEGRQYVTGTTALEWCTLTDPPQPCEGPVFLAENVLKDTWADVHLEAFYVPPPPRAPPSQAIP